MVDGGVSALKVALEGMGEENSDADHTKQCSNRLGHRNPSFEPGSNETAGVAEQSKEFGEPIPLRRYLRIPGNTECLKDGEPPAGPPLAWQHLGGKPMCFRRR
jgi:hypothetical protein